MHMSTAKRSDLFPARLRLLTPADVEEGLAITDCTISHKSIENMHAGNEMMIETRLTVSDKAKYS